MGLSPARNVAQNLSARETRSFFTQKEKTFEPLILRFEVFSNVDQRTDIVEEPNFLRVLPMAPQLK